MKHLLDVNILLAAMIRTNARHEQVFALVMASKEIS